MATKTKSRNRQPSVIETEPVFSDESFAIRMPEMVQSRLAGAGELPQIGNSITLAGIQQAIRQSELGEPLFLFSLFRDMIQNSSHLQAEMGKRIMSFMGKNESIEPEDKNNPEDIKAAEVIQDMTRNCINWAEGSIHLANGHLWPISGAEKIYEPIEDWEAFGFRHPVIYRLKKLFPIPYALFTYRVAYQNVMSSLGPVPNGSPRPVSIVAGYGTAPNQDVVGATALDVKNWPSHLNPNVMIWNPDDWKPDLRFYSTLNNGQINYDISASLKPDPVRHVLHSANVTTASMRENFGALLRSVLPWWFFQANLRDWWARGMERYGSPFAVAYANTSNKNIFDLLTKAFNQASKINALVIPPQAKIELKEVQVTSMADAYAKAIEVCDTQMTKAILGQTLSTSSKGSGMMGGSGVADLHGEVRSEWTEYDKRRYSEMQWQQIFQPFLRYNGYKGRCKSVRGGQSPANLALFSKTLANAAQAGIFPDESAEQDLTAIFGIKMRIVDVTKLKMEQGEKSKSNKENYGSQ